MIEDNIENIRRSAIPKIKEKIKKYPRYIHPCNKERQEDMKKLKFANGYEFTSWMQQNGIMNSVTNVNLKDMENVLKNAKCKTQMAYKNKKAQELGFKNLAERIKIGSWNNGSHEPLDFNEDCPSWFGEIT